MNIKRTNIKNGIRGIQTYSCMINKSPYTFIRMKNGKFLGAVVKDDIGNKFLYTPDAVLFHFQDLVRLFDFYQVRESCRYKQKEKNYIEMLYYSHVENLAIREKFITFE